MAPAGTAGGAGVSTTAGAVTATGGLLVVAGGLVVSTNAGGGLLAVVSVCVRRLFRLPATLHQQGHQTDAVNGQDEEDRDLYAGTTLVFLLQSGALWNEWILIVHFQMALLRLSIEVLVDFSSLRSGVFPQKTPKQNSHVSRFASLLHRHCFTIYVGGAAADTPTY